MPRRLRAACPLEEVRNVLLTRFLRVREDLPTEETIFWSVVVLDIDETDDAASFGVGQH
jgi:hypothetical protein